MPIPVPLKGPEARPAPLDAPPHPLVLAALLDRFLAYWAGSECRFHPGEPPAAPVKPVELFVQWTGSIRGAFRLRIPTRLMEEWRENRKLQQLNGSGPGDFLKEMGTLFAVYLMHTLWMDEFFEMGPVLARTAKLPGWPAGAAQSRCFLEVDRHPVELGLWVESSPGGGR